MFVLNTDTNSRINEANQEQTNIDLIIATHKIVTETETEESEENMGSDHQIINAKIKKKYTHTPEKKSNTRIYNQNKIDWRKLLLSTIRKEKTIDEKEENLQEKYDGIEKIIKEAIGEATEENKRRPEATGRRKENENNTRKKQHKPEVWWDRECKEKREEWKKATKGFYKEPRRETWEIMKSKEEEYKKTIKKKKRIMGGIRKIYKS